MHTHSITLGAQHSITDALRHVDSDDALLVFSAIPQSPSSHTRALWPADPAPLHWPALTYSPRSLAALTADNEARRAARAEVDLRRVRRMVAELAAMAGEGVAL